jgi:protein-tyrosine-phosphatase
MFNQQQGIVLEPFVVVFVCTGNMCRSPLAEGTLKDLLIDEAERTTAPVPVKVISAGTHACDGCGASRNAVLVAQEAGINLEHHVSRPLDDGIVYTADLILTMERSHKEFIDRVWPGLHTVHVLKQYSRTPDETRAPDIKDPIGSNMAVYHDIFNEIRDEVVRVAPVIIGLARKRSAGTVK